MQHFLYCLDFLAVVFCSFEGWSGCARLPPTGTEKMLIISENVEGYFENVLNGSVSETCANIREQVHPWNAGNTVGMLKVLAERTMANVCCQAEVENKPDKLTNY